MNLGYFPHVPSVLTRIFGFIEDTKKGNDLTKYSETNASPLRSNSGYNKSGKASPVKKVKYVPDYKGESNEKEENNKKNS